MFLSLNLSSVKHFKHQHFSVSYLSYRIVLQIKNFVDQIVVNRLLVNIAYMKIWVHLRKKVSLEPCNKHVCVKYLVWKSFEYHTTICNSQILIIISLI